MRPVSTFLTRKQRLGGAERRTQVLEPECGARTSGSQSSAVSALLIDAASWGRVSA